MALKMTFTHSTIVYATFIYLFAYTAAAPIDEITTATTTTTQTLTDVDYRLPSEIKPSAYNITLHPYLLESDGSRRFTFDGEIFINITTTTPASTLVLHSKFLNYTLSEYWSVDTPNNKLKLQNPISNEVTDKITFAFNSPITVGTNYTLHFIYTGSMSDDMYGFYRSSYVDQQNVTKWLGATQFETIRARRAFPSFDEPNFKATFDVTIIRHKSMKSYCNTRLISTLRKGDYYTDIFERTPMMSSYLLAFVVSDFNERSDGTFAVVARPEYYEQTEYGFNVGQEILNEFDQYLNMPYYEQGIDKMHMAAIPDFAPGAMENWGLITYKEDTLLYDSKFSTLKAKEHIATVIAHEQAHMWFGDIVTCDWWSYTWLNEGFATYFEYHMTAKVETDLQLDQQFVVDQLQTVMDMDSTNSTNPMSNEDPNVQSNPSGMFNSIAYNKGGSVIRMAKHAMGEENFQKSLQEYLMTYKHKNAVPDNLLHIWEKHWPAATPVFKSFTEQVGYPLVTVNVSDDGMALTIKQNRFLLNSTDGSNTELLYTVPFTYTTNLENDFNATTPKFYLAASTAAKTEDLSKKVDWVIANIQETGYYRVNYDTKNWHSIHHALLTSNWGGIHELNRAQIVDDLFQLARSNIIDYDFALDIIEYLKTELNYLPWTAAFNGFNYLTTRLGTDITNFSIYIRQLLERAYDQYGFEEKSTDTSLEIFTREKVLAWSCKYGNENCIRRAKTLFNDMQSKPVVVNMRSVVYCSAMREGTESDFDKLFNAYSSATIPTEQTLILKSLGCVKTKNLIEKQFNIITGINVRRHDKSAALSALYSENNENVTPVFDLVTDRYVELVESMGSYSAVAGVISNIASRFTDESQAKKLQDFNKAHSDKFGASAATLLAAEKTVAINLKWSNDRLDTVRQYLERRTKGSGNATKAFTLLTIVLFSILSMCLN